MNFEAAGTFAPEVLKEALCITDVLRLSARHSKEMRTGLVSVRQTHVTDLLERL